MFVKVFPEPESILIPYPPAKSAVFEFAIISIKVLLSEFEVK